MRKSFHVYDVLVIGGGLSGMLAAAGARQQGVRVGLLADGYGMLELASGCIDLLGTTPAGEPVMDPWEGLATLEPEHPYRLLGRDRVRLGLEAFQAVMAEAGLPYRPAEGGGNQWLPTALGRLRPTYLTPAGAPCPHPAGPVWVVGLRGLTEFQPDVVAEGLRQHWPDMPVLSLQADLPPALGESPHPVQIARLLDTPEGLALLVRALTGVRPHGPAPDLILLPALLGIRKSQEVREAVARALGGPVLEVPLPSPSVPGLRLAEGLRHHLERSEVDLLLGLQATGARVAGGRVEAVEARSPGGPLEIRAGAVVLAAGGLLGRGIQANGRSLSEPIFHLPVTMPEAVWAQPELLSPAGHGFVRCGIRTDEALRPAGYTNLFLCGRMLAGYDPYAEGSGGGVAIATGWHAGQLAGGAAQ